MSPVLLANTNQGLVGRKFYACFRACQNLDGSEDLKKGTQLLEVYALEIQMYTEQKNTKKLKQLYHKALYVKSAIPHPRIMGIIRECGGKMHMHERIWSEAATDFFEVGPLAAAPAECISLDCSLAAWID